VQKIFQGERSGRKNIGEQTQAGNRLQTTCRYKSPGYTANISWNNLTFIGVIPAKHRSADKIMGYLRYIQVILVFLLNLEVGVRSEPLLESLV